MKPVIGERGSVEDVHHLRLMALLHELVMQRGPRGAATALGIAPRTVVASMEGRTLSGQVREALERGIGSRVGSVAARQRRRNEALERCLGHWKR